MAYDGGEQNIKGGGQCSRPEHERRLPEWQRDALDRNRQLEAARRLASPELFAQLGRIEQKLDALFARKHGDDREADGDKTKS